MSYPNEANQLWREVHQGQAASRARRKKSNLAILRASSLPFIYRNDNDTVLMRDPRYPQIDFYCPMSKWIYNGRYVLGDAQALVEWLERKRKS